MGKLLSGGLILRSLAENANDKKRFPEFLHNAFEIGGDWQETNFTAWINDLLNTHPSMKLEHIWCVVDPAAKGKIVSGLFLIPQLWRYEDVQIPVGRPEIVGTLAAYRRRGLVRELFTILHQYSQAQGHLIQAITGIPFFYRQFGYTFAVDLGGRGQIPFTAIPKLGKDETPKYHVRPAESSDIPTLITLDASESRHALLTTIRDKTLWDYELNGRHPKSFWYSETYMIIDTDGQSVGYVTLNDNDYPDNIIGLNRWVIGENANHLQTFEDTLRAIRDIAKEKNDNNFAFYVNDNMHPALVKIMHRNFGMATQDRMYAWYLRVADHVAFIQWIAPVLERRLVHSAAHQYSGKLRVNFYQHDDLLITFEQGKITDVCLTSEKGRPHLNFPFDTWLNVVFGANSESELHKILPDTLSTAEASVLVDILFPKKKSSLFPVS
ncbi:MAG: GNAT family N-acetyltransferase [Phototrophicaceae bacterium]